MRTPREGHFASSNSVGDADCSREGRKKEAGSKRQEERSKRQEERVKRQEGRSKRRREEARGKRREARGKRKESRGKIKERSKREESRGSGVDDRKFPICRQTRPFYNSCGHTVAGHLDRK